MAEPQHLRSLEQQRVRNRVPVDQQRTHVGGPLEAARDQLLDRAHLFDDPEAYRAGVLDAVEELRGRTDGRDDG